MSFRKLQAFIKRDFLIFLSYKFDLVLQILSVFVISFFALYYFFSNNNISGNEYLLMMLGIVLLDFMYSCMGVLSAKVREAQQQGHFEILFLSKTSFNFVIFASIISTFIKCVFRMFFYLSIGFFFSSYAFNFTDFAKIISIILLNTLPFIGIGLISASFTIFYKRGNPINFFIAIISIFFSGIFFNLNQLPTEITSITANSPLALSRNAIEVILENSSNNPEIYQKSLAALIIYASLILPIGFYSIDHAIKASRKTGTLNFY